MTAARRALERRAGLKIAAAFIAEKEGGQSADGRFHAYWDRTGHVWTIGYGHTRAVHSGMVWSKAKARRVLRRDLARKYGFALDALKLPLKRNMYAGFLSAIYNLGIGMLGTNHDLGRELRAHHWRKAADSLSQYVFSGGVKLAGLVTRRRDERALVYRDL